MMPRVLRRTIGAITPGEKPQLSPAVAVRLIRIPSKISVLCLKYRSFEVVSSPSHTSRGCELRGCKDWPFATFCRTDPSVMGATQLDRTFGLDGFKIVAQLLAKLEN
jgi:hypothetical protein